MRSIIYFTVIVLLIGVTACQKPSSNVAVESPVDSLVTIWADNWNNHDSLALRNMFDPNAVVFDNNLVIKNSEELMAKLIRPYYNIMSDMRIKKINEWLASDRAGFSGIWSVNIFVRDTVASLHTGAFTCIWEKSIHGEWKVTNAHISDFTD